MPIHNLNHVNMFLQVIASGSISSAARILRKSHTAVSSAVSNLESTCAWSWSVGTATRSNPPSRRFA